MKKRMEPISNHLDRTSLVCKGFRGKFSCGTELMWFPSVFAKLTFCWLVSFPSLLNDCLRRTGTTIFTNSNWIKSILSTALYHVAVKKLQTKTFLSPYAALLLVSTKNCDLCKPLLEKCNIRSMRRELLSYSQRFSANHTLVPSSSFPLTSVSSSQAQ